MPLDRRTIRWNGWGWVDRSDSISRREEVWAWLACELHMPSLLFTPALPLDEAKLPKSQLAAQDRRVLGRIVGSDRMREDRYERAFHASGRGYHDLLRLRGGDLAMAPDAVVYPDSEEQVLMLLAYASERSIALIPYGGGTSVAGGVTPCRNGHNAAVTVDLSRMDRVEQVDPNSLAVRAQPGICGPALEKALAAQGFTLGHFPQSFEFSTLGGWIAGQSVGQQANRYGTAKDWLLATELATPRGSLREHAYPASAAGPRLVDLSVGSQGVFGIITSATLRVHRMPDAAAARAWLFQDFSSGASAIRGAMQTGVPAAMLRLSDAKETQFHRAFSQLGAPVSIAGRAFAFILESSRYAKPCVLIAEFEGTHDRVRSAKAEFGRIARAHGALPLGRRPAERWQQSRFQAPYLRDPMLDRGVGVDRLEIATSWSNLPRLCAGVKCALETAIGQTAPRAGARGIVMCHIGRSCAYGASLCFTYIFPRALDSEVAQWRAIRQSAAQCIAANGGAIADRNGVGDDLPWMAQEEGALGIEALRAIKRTLDPSNILNPGKLIV